MRYHLWYQRSTKFCQNIKNGTLPRFRSQQYFGFLWYQFAYIVYDRTTRESIAKEDDIGAGTVTAIIQEARKQEEYNDIDLLRQVSVKLKEEEIESPLLGFAIRLKRIMEDNEINEDQIEPIIQDFATYCLRLSISFDKLIQIGREALYLEEKFGISVERIPEYIIQGKKTIDRLEEQQQ